MGLTVQNTEPFHYSNCGWNWRGNLGIEVPAATVTRHSTIVCNVESQKRSCDLSLVAILPIRAYPVGRR